MTLKKFKCKNPVLGIAVHPNERLLATALVEGQLQLLKYSLDPEALFCTLGYSKKAHEDACRTVGFSSDGSLLASGGRDLKLTVRDTGSGNKIAAIDSAHSLAVNTLCFLSEKVLATGDDCGDVKFWDVRLSSLSNGFKSVGHLENHDDYISRIYALDRKTCVATSGDGTLTFMDIRRLDKALQSIEQGNDLTDCALSLHGSTLAVSEAEGNVLLWKCGEWNDIVERLPSPMRDTSIDRLTAMSEDTILAACGDGSIWRLSLHPNRFRERIENFQSGLVADIASVPGGQYAISAVDDSIMLSDIKKKEGCKQRSTHTSFDGDTCHFDGDSDSGSDSGSGRKKRKRKTRLKNQQPGTILRKKGAIGKFPQLD